MMHQLLNTLFVQTQGAYVHLHQDTVRVEVEGQVRLQVPLHHLGGLAVFGNVAVSPFLIHRFAEDGRSLAWFSLSGRFFARVQGPTPGNVLLRVAQHEAREDSERVLHLARRFIAGKLHNARQLLQRGARERAGAAPGVGSAIVALKDALDRLEDVTALDALRGIEGHAAAAYFQGLSCLVLGDIAGDGWGGRTRRPPRDPLNAMLSFAYALLVNDCTAACEGVGLDPQVGYLHTLRPGRPALALDLAEEFRPALADRVVLALVNRRQLQQADFETRPGGTVQMTDRARRTFIEAYQRRKQDEVTHPLLQQRVPIGLLPHVQARLLARYLRGDAVDYVPFRIR
jgi:CRISPR-associated protein Cas1